MNTNLPDNDLQTSILIKTLSDYTGTSTGQKYFDKLVNGINKYLNFCCGLIFDIDDSSINNHHLIAKSPKHINGLYEYNALVTHLLKNYREGTRGVGIADWDEISGSADFDNIGNFKSLIYFFLTDSENAIAGIAIFCSEQELNNTDFVRESIACLIPRACAELERIQMKEKLRVYENYYNNLIDSTLDAIWEADVDGTIRDVNSSFCDIYGFTENQIIGKPYAEFMTVASAHSFMEHLALLKQGKSIYKVESDHKSQDKGAIKVCYNIIPKYDNNNVIVGIIGTTRDISASVKAQETIKNNSELFSSILAKLPVIFFRLDKEGYLIDIRGNGLKRMGVEDMDWVGKPCFGLFIGMDEKIKAALTGDTVFFENKGTYDGTPWWFYTSVFFDNWTGIGAVGFSVDITEQKYVEEQLVGLLNKNRRLAQKLVEVQEDERRNLARELHDELGQSITAVKSLATVMSASTGNQYTEIRSLSNSIIDLSGRLYDVVKNIMQRLRPDIIDSLDFTEAINNCIVRSQLETIGVNCHLSIEGQINDLDEIVQVTIYRIIQECLTNISKHAMASNVTIAITRQSEKPNKRQTDFYDIAQRNIIDTNTDLADTVRLMISDDGIGMAVGRATNTSENASRHGLQGINERVSAIGGRLRIFGEPGKGVTIEAVLTLGDHLDDVHDITEYIAEPNITRLGGRTPKRINTH
ncbi:MAG: PAS domain S-box protein [Gammaproteobacteria bacterium]|nr:PAS domain S-box protein [Gammaproteobacteria bacterium]